ncbi:hypothetical protein GCM10010187_76970 [Actinomadura coerulea]|nr:hypothetical protein GCM10010187_76970 [Actinomadura coerulea]
MKPAARPFAWRLAVVLCRYNLGVSALSKEFPQGCELAAKYGLGQIPCRAVQATSPVGPLV